jgi:hypothetical protein
VLQPDDGLFFSVDLCLCERTKNPFVCILKRRAALAGAPEAKETHAVAKETHAVRLYDVAHSPYGVRFSFFSVYLRVFVVNPFFFRTP